MGSARTPGRSRNVAFERDAPGARPIEAAPLADVSKRTVLTVATVAVESLQSLGEMDALARVFDAVLPVVVARAVDAETPLARAVAAMTAFATADSVSLPVDEVYPFFVRGGQLAWGAAERRRGGCGGPCARRRQPRRSDSRRSHPSPRGDDAE